MVSQAPLLFYTADLGGKERGYDLSKRCHEAIPGQLKATKRWRTREGLQAVIYGRTDKEKKKGEKQFKARRQKNSGEHQPRLAEKGRSVWGVEQVRSIELWAARRRGGVGE